MSSDSHRYSNNDITVIWQPGLCKHSTNCWKGLIEVFNPKERPWIKMDGADSARIVSQVQKCPSGALTVIQKNQPGEDPVASNSKSPI